MQMPRYRPSDALAIVLAIGISIGAEDWER